MLPDNKHVLPLQDAKWAAPEFSFLFPFQCFATASAQHTFAEWMEGEMGLTKGP